MRFLAPLAVVLSLAGPTPAAAQPSFDCGSAKLSVEKAICRSPTLAALDREIAATYGRVLEALPEAMATTLRRQQRTFLAARDEAYGWPGEDLELRLSDQIAHLTSIEVRGRSTLEGSWHDGRGGVEATARPDGAIDVLIGTSEPVQARWLCDVAGVARATGAPGSWRLEADPAIGEGWTIDLTVRDGQLTVTSKAASEGEVAPFCGAGGTIDGVYLPVRARSDWFP